MRARSARPVYVAPYTAALPIDSSSPCYAGYLPPSFKQISERLAPHDVLFFVGGTGLRTTLYSEARLPQTKLWIGNDARARAVDGEFELATVTDTAAGLAAISRALDVKRPAPKPQRPKPLCRPRRKKYFTHHAPCTHCWKHFRMRSGLTNRAYRLPTCANG